MQMVEDREKHMKQTFASFDYGNTGTIDMDELIVMMDELGLLTKLRTDSEEFVRDMFVKYDTNFDGVLSYDEFIGLYNCALDDSLGRRKKDMKLQGSKVSGATLEARKKLAMEKASKKAEEASRIHRQNMELKARIQAQGKGKDPKALEAEIDRQRRALAKARAEAKAVARAEVQKSQAAMEAARDLSTAYDISDAKPSVETDAAAPTKKTPPKTRKSASPQPARAGEQGRQRSKGASEATGAAAGDSLASDGGADAAAAAKAWKESESELLARPAEGTRERMRERSISPPLKSGGYGSS